MPRAARPPPGTDPDLRSRLRRLLAGASRRDDPEPPPRRKPRNGARVSRRPARVVGSGRDTGRGAGRRCDRPPNEWRRGATAAARRQGLRRVHRGRTRRGAPRRWRAWSGIPANAGRGGGFADAARASIFDARSPRACAPAATSCGCRGAAAVRPRPLVLLCDVSGSMERYSRMLLHFAHAVTRRHQRVEAFLFSTRLTRITRELRLQRPDDALAAVSRAVPDWSGGTRIGEAVREFHQRWGRRVLHAARWCCSSPMGGTAAIRWNSANRSRGCSEAAIG